MKNLLAIEKKWQKRWEEKKAFVVKDNPKEKKFYVLEMFPYPSGSGLHMGHAFNYTIGDIYARFKRMQGFNVLYPMGYDAFGLPAENAAIKEKTHPKPYTEKAINNFIKQQKSLGLSYDWTRMLKTCDPEYYKWNQFFFLKFLEKGLAYRKKASVNWCPKCTTVLANEQVHNGTCWRHTDTGVEEKQLEQWFFKITDYADELLKDIDTLKWPERIKSMQKHWIGKSHGIDIWFKLENENKIISTFTTRCDTIYSVTFLAVAPESPLIKELTSGTKYEKEAQEFLNKIKKQSLADRTNEAKEKEGFFTGKYAINPSNNRKIPIYIANFALMYGSGVVMCDAHDKRDFAFAKKYNIPLVFVISKDGKPQDAMKAKEAYIDNGLLFDSGKFSGMSNMEALPKIADWLEKEKYGKKTINFKLRDWLISRQRYWGTPIPVIYCDACGIVPVPEKDLPVLLPEKVTFGKGNPLETNEQFVKVKCPTCKKPARRETDTMDTFVDSSWYYLRYADSKNNKMPFDKKIASYWMPVDQYIGGAEHATMHLIYARFFTKVLRDLGYVKIDEPFPKLFNQGMLHKDGFVMSKSRGNVVLPEQVSEQYGIDTARFFLVSLATPDKDDKTKLIYRLKNIKDEKTYIKELLNLSISEAIKLTIEFSENSLLSYCIRKIYVALESMRRKNFLTNPKSLCLSSFYFNEKSLDEIECDLVSTMKCTIKALFDFPEFILISKLNYLNMISFCSFEKLKIQDVDTADSHSSPLHRNDCYDIIDTIIYNDAIFWHNGTI
ncbi:MAG: leucine--tRNA ligase, partial [Nanoarchaeota archaeon]